MKLVLPSTFKVLNYKHIPPGIQGFELIDKKLSKTHLSESELIERTLIINSLLSLSIFLIRSNLVKSFNLKTQEKNHLRHTLVKFGDDYYHRSITLLRRLIATSNGNSDLTLIISHLLNKVSILEFKSLENSLVFNNGLIGIIQNLVCSQKIKRIDEYSADLQVILKFIVFGGKAVQFPSYNYNVLYEIQGYLSQFEHEFKTEMLDFPNNNLIFHFNHLKCYVDSLISQFECEVTIDHNVSYYNLRSWLVNLPNKVAIIETVKDPIEYMILTFYRTMCTVLNNLFPQTAGMFLIGFHGNLEVFVQPDYSVKYKTFKKLNLDEFEISQAYKMQELWNYFIRLKTFFTKRYNVLCIVFNYMNFGSLVNIVGRRKLNNKEITKRYNEVPIHKFNETIITNYHYPHVASQVDFNRLNDDNTIDFGTLEDLPNPFTFNHHHWHSIRNSYAKRYFRRQIYQRKPGDFFAGRYDLTPNQEADFGDDFDTGEPEYFQESVEYSEHELERQVLDQYPDLDESDPILQYMVGNLIKTPKEAVIKFGYELFSNFVDSELLVRDLVMDYFNMINSRIEYPIEIQINEISGLDYRDRNPLDYMVNTDYNFMTHIDGTLQLFKVNDFFNHINSMIKQLPNTPMVEEQDLIEKFYDDLNDMYFH